MGKLFSLKEWLTVADTARHLSIVFGEDVSEADVLRLALDGRLRLSVHFVNHARARCGKVVTWEETDWFLCPSLIPRKEITAETEAPEKILPWPPKLEALVNDMPEDERAGFVPFMRSLKIDDERFLNLDDQVTSLQGVWDLPLIGAEQLDIEHEYQRLTRGPEVTLVNIEGAFVERRDGEMCQLQEHYENNEYQPGSKAQLEKLKDHFVSMMAIDPTEGGAAEAEARLKQYEEDRKKFLENMRTRPQSNNYYPAGGLPKDAVIVVRTEALREFEQAVNGAPNGPEKPIAANERNSLLTIIAALCEYSAINPQERGAASQIAKLTEEIGAVVSDDTVRRALAKIPDALETRRK